MIATGKIPNTTMILDTHFWGKSYKKTTTNKMKPEHKIKWQNQGFIFWGLPDLWVTHFYNKHIPLSPNIYGEKNKNWFKRRGYSSREDLLVDDSSLCRGYITS